MGEVDWASRLIADKVLTVIAIIGIIVVNTVLVAKIVRVKDFAYKPKCMTLIALAIGDLFLALFSMIINARTIFESSDYKPSCRTTITAMIYNGNIIHFVYGAGLVILALELVFRNPSVFPSSPKHDLTKAFIFSSLPWITALVILLPLSMAGIDWDNNCNFGDTFTDDRNRATVWISVILPATTAFITSLAIFCVRLAPDDDDTLQLTLVPSADDQFREDKSASQTAFPQYRSTQPANEVQNTSDTKENSIKNPPDTAAGRKKERMILFWVSGIFYTCLIPNAFFTLQYEVDPIPGELDMFSRVVLSGFCSWLMIFRSVFTPAVWLFCSTN